MTALAWPRRLLAGTILAATLVAAAQAPAVARRSSPPHGNDISSPQCGSPYPTGQTFGVVAVNSGLPYSANPCLASEYQWTLGSSSTTRPKASLYLNTANPGPVKSSHWPTGATAPKACDGTWSANCSYDYGWNAAQDSFGDAIAAVGQTAAASSPWWLDVETANSWNSSDLATNRADIQGARDYLQTVRGVASVGIYSTAAQWNQITGATSPSSSVNAPFAATPNWVAGASSATSAPTYCTNTFTGGRVTYVQYLAGGFDADYAC
jgi:hypothetical protein